MSDTMVGDRVSLINEGSVFTDAGSLVRFGDTGVVVGHKGMDLVVVHWNAYGISGLAPRGSLVVESRGRQRSR